MFDQDRWTEFENEIHVFKILPKLRPLFPPSFLSKMILLESKGKYNEKECLSHWLDGFLSTALLQFKTHFCNLNVICVFYFFFRMYITHFLSINLCNFRHCPICIPNFYVVYKLYNFIFNTWIGQVLQKTIYM